MNPGVVILDQIISKLLTLGKHNLQFLLLHFVLHMLNIIQLNLNYLIIDQSKLSTILRTVLREIQANQSDFLTFKN